MPHPVHFIGSKSISPTHCHEKFSNLSLLPPSMPLSKPIPDAESAATDGSKLRLLQPLATLMGKDEDLTIFRRFDEVNVLRLLLLQEEVETLTKEFKETLLKTSKRQTPATSGYLASYRLGEQAASPSEEPDTELESDRKRTWEQLKTKLKEYSMPFVFALPDKSYLLQVMLTHLKTAP